MLNKCTQNKKAVLAKLKQEKKLKSTKNFKSQL